MRQTFPVKTAEPKSPQLPPTQKYYKEKEIQLPVMFSSQQNLADMMTLDKLEESFNEIHKANEDMPIFFGRKFRVENHSAIPMIQLRSKFIDNYADTVYDVKM